MSCRRIVFGVLLCVVLSINGCNNLDDVSSVEKDERVYNYSTEFIHAEKASIGDGYYIISKKIHKPTTIPSCYIIEEYSQIRSQTLGLIEDSHRYVFKFEMDYFNYDIYSIKTSEKIKTIDVNAIFKEKCPELQVKGIASMSASSFKEKPMIQFLMEKHPKQFEDGIEDTLKRVYLDIETEELWITDYSVEELEEDRAAISEWDLEGRIFSDADSRFLKLNGLWETTVIYLKNWDGVCWVNTPLYSLPEENEGLYTLFPQLKEEVKAAKLKTWDSEDDVPYVNIYLVDHPTPEELMRLLLPEEQEINFEGMILSRYMSFDGEDHKVGSFEEFKQYQKPIWKQLDDSEVYMYFKSTE